MKSKTAGILLILFLWAGNAFPQSYMSQNGHVEFTSEVPLHTFTGVTDHLIGKINLSNGVVDFYLDLNTLDTGNSKRDKDMQYTLETEKYPFAEFFGTLSSSFDSTSSAEQPATVKGEFTVHGVTRNVTIDGTLQKTDTGLRVKASWTLNLNDYNIKPPGILFYRVDEKIDIKFNTLLKPIDE